jgi:hypothetical protein
VSDPAAFLGSLRVDEGVFDLGGKLFPGSIRDQVIRARLFVQQLREFGFLDTPRTICIVGAGVAGITAAIAFCESGGHDVMLADQSVLPLSLLADAEHRRISPTLYDWPAEHHSAVAYSGIPYYEEGPPSLVRNEWLSVFRRLVTTGKLKWRGQTEAFPAQDTNVRFTQSGGSQSEQSFDLVILCKGYGQEKAVPMKNGTQQFSPFPFWKPDPYPAIARRRPPKGRVAVLGGGDGAVQDMLRFVTLGCDARYLLNQIISALTDAPSKLKRIWDAIENERRCRALAGPVPAAGLWVDVENGISDLLDIPALSKTLDDLIQFNEVNVYFQDEALGPCYPLNRFLALLFHAHLKRKSGLELLQPGHSVTAIECNCPDGDHFERPHTVLFAPRHGETSGKAANCSIVVPRLGVDEATLPIKRRMAHDLPYWISDWKPVV